MTTSNYKAKTLSPVIPVADMKSSIRFYADVLGFDIVGQSDDYSVLTRDGASLHLARAADQSVLEATRGHMSAYLEVEDIESLWSHVSRFRNRYKIRDLFDRGYGMREFHIMACDDCLILVGEPIKAAPRQADKPNASGKN